MQLNTAYEGRHRLPPYDSYLDVDFTKGGKSENHDKNPQSTGEMKNVTHISSKFDNQLVGQPRWSPIQL